MWAVSPMLLTNCWPITSRPTPPCVDARCGQARKDWPQYIGNGDWWASHVPLERMVAAMLDDPFAHIGSVGFDALERLLRGEAQWLPANLPDGEPADPHLALTLAFANSSVWREALPYSLRQRLGEGSTPPQPLSPEEAVCAAALLSDAISMDAAEQRRWMEAVRAAGRHAMPDGEHPFKLHSTVYPQLARSWPIYSGNLTAVFSPAGEPHSSGMDRFACSGESGNEDSDRNVDAGEIQTAGYKTPLELDGVLVSPPPAHPGVGRRLASKRRPAFEAEFPSSNSSFDEIRNFEREWSHHDRFPFPMPYKPKPVDTALFRLRSGRHSVVAVLAPFLLPEKVFGILRDPERRRFLVSNSPLQEDAACAECTRGQRCFAPRPAPSASVVPVAAVLFRCGLRAAAVLGALDAPSAQAFQDALRRVESHSKLDHARACAALRALGSMGVEAPSTAPQLSNGGGVTRLLDGLRQVRLRAPDSLINLQNGSARNLQKLDAVCSLSMKAAGALGGENGAAVLQSCPWPNPNSAIQLGDRGLERTEVPEARSSGSEPSPPCVGGRLSPCKCDALMRDPKSILTHMWSATGWKLIHSLNGRKGDGPCWGERDGQTFFDLVATGTLCNRSWYNEGRAPRLDAEVDAPPVLGFDDDIESYCTRLNREQGRETSANETQPTGDSAVDSAAGRPSRRRLVMAEKECARASRTVLSLDDSEYSSCNNLAWQVCGAMGRLPGQHLAHITFATAPGQVHINGSSGRPALGACSGFAPHGCGPDGYANDNIFFLEVCLYNQICSNRDDLFRLQPGELFTCRIEPGSVRGLQALLLQANGGAG